eukprot:gene53275-62680_t
MDCDEALLRQLAGGYCVCLLNQPTDDEHRHTPLHIA